VRSPFETHHYFEEEREVYEKKVFVDGKNISLVDVAPTKYIGSINDPETSRMLNELGPEIITVFGTGRIHDDIIGNTP
jgi:hypothetical protein|tara:strand:+ start:999 stop:1232 length:234 start_codon:yes stop_codon:yes gene_type:complete